MSKAVEELAIPKDMLLGLPELERKIIEEILIPKGAIIIKGRTILMRFSEINYLPDELSGGFKLPWLTYEVFGPSKVVTESDMRGMGAKKMISYNASLLKFSSSSVGVGVWSGYSVKVSASKIDPHKTINHHDWGPSTPDIEKEYLSKWIQGGFVEEGKKRIITVTTADPTYYLFMLFSPTMDSKILAPMKEVINGKVASKRTTIRFKLIDIQAESNNEVNDIMIASDAVQWVKNLNVHQLRILKPKVTGQINSTESRALGVETSKEGMMRELIKLCNRYGAVILKFKEEVGGDVPREAVAKGILADAITFGILEPHKEFGLLVGLAHENVFNGLCTRISVDAINNTRLQFMPTATPSEWYGYIAANETLVDVAALEGLVEKTAPTFAGERFKVGNYQALTSLMKTNGRFKNLYNKE